MHLSSVHSWCHFITHILNISKHSFKCVCVCWGGGWGVTSQGRLLCQPQQLMDVTSRCALNVVNVADVVFFFLFLSFAESFNRGLSGDVVQTDLLNT